MYSSSYNIIASFRARWQATYQQITYQKVTPWPATGQTSSGKRHSDTVALLIWRQNPDITSADATLFESGRTRHEITQSICSVILQAASSYFIILYDPSHPEQQKDRHGLKLPLCSHPEIHISNLFADPSPGAFVLACLVYALAAASFHQLHANHQYQNRFLTAGGSVAILLSLAHLGTVKTFMPCTITIALLSSSIFHHLYPNWRLEAAEEIDGVEGDIMNRKKHTQTVA